MRRLLVPAAIALAALGACTRGKAKHYDPVAFPPGFLWGTATAAHQVEGGNDRNDWWAWEHVGGKIKNSDTSGAACDAYHLYDQDFALAQSLGQNAHRFSIEWSRIEPTLGGPYDAAEIAHYHAVLTSLKAHGLKPIVTLEHYTLPIWADNPLGPTVTGTAGWASQTTQDEFVKWSGDMAEEYGADVDDWIVFNEPMVSAVASLEGVFPPDIGGSLDKATAMVAGMIQAHARAYDAIHARDTVDADTDGVAAKVGIAQAIVDFFPANPAIQIDVDATARLDHIFNKLFVDAITRGDLDLDLDGAYTSPGEGQGIASLKDRLDFIGVNYYRKYLVVGGLGPPILGIPEEDPDLPHNDLGWSIYPKGIYDALAEMNSYGLPMMVTENGIADAADAKRPGYIVDHLLWVSRAIADGMPVTGYMHWSLMDNFEWAEGYAKRFGIVHVDYETQKRTPKSSYEWYRQVIAEHRR